MTEQEENRMRANIIQRAYDAGREAQLQIQNLQEEINHLRAELEHLNRKIAHGCIDALCSECDKEK